MNAFPWTVYFILLAAGLLGSAAVIPYALAINPKAVALMKENASGISQPGKQRLATPVLVLISGLQSLVLIGLATFLGLLAAGQVGLGTPTLQAGLEGRPVMETIMAWAPASVLLGLTAGVVMLVLEGCYFMPRIPRALASLDSKTAFWKRVLACFYGGIVEEILLRLFLMSALVWLFGLFWKTDVGQPAPGAFWLANILAAVLFGASHLPATTLIATLTPTVVARALLLNAVAGATCGYLYMRYGLEAAMLSHFSLDILLHLIATPFMRRRANSLPRDSVPQAT
jgi:membrane protease YdiL (CAAX protease family)